MAGLKVQGCIVIEHHIDAASSQSIGDRPKTKVDKRCGPGEAEQSDRSQKGTEGRDLPGAESPVQTTAEQTGNDGAGGDQYGHDTDQGYGNIQLPVYGRPGGTKQGIRQAHTDESQINQNEDNCCHKDPLSTSAKQALPTAQLAGSSE